MMNNIYADTAKEVLQLIGTSGAQMCGPICNAIVKSKCCKTEAAVAVIKEVTKDMTVFSEISGQFFTAYTKSLELIEKTHQTTVDAYMVMLANDDNLTFDEKVDKLKELQKESNKTFLDYHKILAGAGVAVATIFGGTLAYRKHCDMKVLMAKTAASPFAGTNQILFAIANRIKKN